jgi:hypothetical protein
MTTIMSARANELAALVFDIRIKLSLIEIDNVFDNNTV